MLALPKEKARAVQLRKQGKTYGEIAKQILVSKSTLSLWLRDVEVSAEFLSRIRQKKLDAVKKGWEARRKERIDRTKQITDAAREEVSKFYKQPLWLVGVTLYWAEGHKEKSWRPGALVTFTNMDENTIIIFRNWCRKYMDVSDGDFVYSLYVHATHEMRTLEIKQWWARKLSINPDSIAVYYKKHTTKHVRHNDDDNYHGVCRVRVRKSVDMNRRIASWTSEMVRSLEDKNKL